jgi:hypothetical protein
MFRFQRRAQRSSSNRQRARPTTPLSYAQSEFPQTCLPRSSARAARFGKRFTRFGKRFERSAGQVGSNAKAKHDEARKLALWRERMARDFAAKVQNVLSAVARCL